MTEPERIECAVCRYSAMMRRNVRLPGVWSMTFQEAQRIFFCRPECEAEWLRANQDREMNKAGRKAQPARAGR